MDFKIGDRVYDDYDREFGNIKRIDGDFVLIYLSNGFFVERSYKYVYHCFKKNEEVMVSDGNDFVFGKISSVDYSGNVANVEIGGILSSYYLRNIRKIRKGCPHNNIKESWLGIGGGAELIKFCKDCGEILKGERE